MNAMDLLFRTERFNLSKVGEHFINPCCFGEDLARWLSDKLQEKGVAVSEPYQEDWGWELPASGPSGSYYLCLSGNADEERANPDLGEWRIIVVKKRSLKQRILGQGVIQADDAMIGLIVRILKAEDRIRDVHFESDEVETRNSGLATRD